MSVYIEPIIADNAVETPIGYLPKSINTEGLDISADVLSDLLSVDVDVWKEEVADQKRTNCGKA